MKKMMKKVLQKIRRANKVIALVMVICMVLSSTIVYADVNDLGEGTQTLFDLPSTDPAGEDPSSTNSTGSGSQSTFDKGTPSNIDGDVYNDNTGDEENDGTDENYSEEPENDNQSNDDSSKDEPNDVASPSDADGSGSDGADDCSENNNMNNEEPEDEISTPSDIGVQVVEFEEEGIATKSNIPKLLGAAPPMLGTAPTGGDFLTFTAEEANAQIKFQYKSGTAYKWNESTSTWDTYPSSATPIILTNVGDKVYFKGTNVTTAAGNSFTINSGKISASGSVTSLTDGVGTDPNVTLTDWCYYQMFGLCTSLTTPPKLPALTLKEHCYRAMFVQCSSLTTTPDLPATTLKSTCYYQMFSGCTSLTKLPTLPATTLAESCYNSMFYNCTSLVLNKDKAIGSREIEWKIPATSTSALYWNDVMFGNCPNVDLDGSGGKICALNTTYYTLGVNEQPMTITTSPQTKYREGDTFDPTGLVVTLSDGSSTVVGYSDDPTNFTFDPTTTTALATTNTEVKIKYTNGTTKYAATLNINVYAPSGVSGYSWTGGSQPTIKMGSIFDATNFNATLSYPSDSGLSDKAYSYAGHESDFTFTSPVVGEPILSSSNTKTVSFTCKGKSYTSSMWTDLYLTNPSSATAVSQPTKTTYYEGDTFDFAGMSMQLNFSDSTTTGPFPYSTTAYQSYYSVSQPLVAGMTSIDVYFCGGAASVPITVNARSLTSISIDAPPATTKYFIDDKFDPTGLVIGRTYDYGSPDTLAYSATSGITYSPTTLTTSGTTIAVTISYGGKNATQNVEVHNVSSLTVVASPSKISYTAGQTFNPSGMVLKATDGAFTRDYIYTNGCGMTFSPSGALSTSDTSITVTFKGKTVSIPITVAAAPVPTPVTPSGGGSSSGGGSTGVIPSIKTDNPIIQNTNDLTVANNPLAPENVTPVTRNASTDHVVNANTTSVNWVTDPTTGKWRLNIGGSGSNSSGGTNASYGFYTIAKATPEVDAGTGLNVMKTTVSTYYFDQSSLMHIGWLTTADLKTYYFETLKNNDEGKMISGWKDIDKKWYYFSGEGHMLRDTNTPDGFKVDANGVWVR